MIEQQVIYFNPKTMSNFNCRIKVKKTGEIKEAYAMDNYFGLHKYGYVETSDTLTKFWPMQKPDSKVYSEEEIEILTNP